MTPEEQKAYLEKCLAALEKAAEDRARWNREHRKKGDKATKKYRLSHPEKVKQFQRKARAKAYAEAKYIPPWWKS